MTENYNPETRRSGREGAKTAETVLLTGGTGFLGTEMASRLAGRDGVLTYVLVRAADEEEAYHRLRGLWYYDRELYSAIGKSVFPVVGDFTKRDLGMSKRDREVLKDEVGLVIHAGAEIGFDKSRDELYETNVEGTINMVEFAKGMKAIRHFVHLSTAYVAGQKKGRILEEAASGAPFSSNYEASKAEAEEVVRQSGLPFSICRPGMIIGESGSGWVRNFNTIYYVLKLLLLGKLRVLPVRRDMKLNLVPGDYVADCVLKVAFSGTEKNVGDMSEMSQGRTFHITCPNEMAPEAGELVDYVIEWAVGNLGETISRPVFIKAPFLRSIGLKHNSKTERKTKNYVSNLATLMPYFFSEQDFDRNNTDSLCGRYDLDWRGYIDGILDFACRKNFMRQTGETVFEQAKVRRASKRYPVSYFDIGSDGISKVTGPEVNERIERIADALWAWGVRKGDRIALAGVNSVDYMCLEQAIGLTGCVSVPIYYTTPAAEASVLLEKSGSKWFFVGDRRMLTQVPEIEAEVRIVTFSEADRPDGPGCAAVSSSMTWERFLAKATSPAPPQYPDPEDLATIRYTSGTTGEPKGVTFNYGQLAWMGEVMTNLFTWSDRNRRMKYLSFLPLSHVVEGILASYAPYYLLAEVEYYYLNDFGSLVDALPKVRPNIFFSVPRFYEKVWEQVTENPLGRRWLKRMETSVLEKGSTIDKELVGGMPGSGKSGSEMPGGGKPGSETPGGGGVIGTLLGAVLRRATLKKAGLDECRQLIVGSAPVSEALLLHFRELGIEIHNAYGQTEAPLITINRLGDNVIPTVGTALPETEIDLSDEGELIVKGPQVTPGYYRLDSENIRDGVLMTGDLGTIDENGHVTLLGRKKDFVITAYGKNISITKLEEKLKDIPIVSEAVLIGENRPYCTALIWLEEGAGGLLDTSIDEINRSLSHPEQIRDYRIIEHPLSIHAGELTPNLKVKRSNVEKHFADDIESMYRPKGK